ncbi:MAG: molecular chaperone DnaJ [Rhodospirillales bacterium]|jgi:DnaJ-class molecular chaperone|nr:molecular chaperone DnaJ [Rhodospirillales bacterium]
MKDPYDVLGLRRTAPADEIKRAYRKLAKKLHPDMNPGNKRIEQQFKELTAAYEILSDPTKRARFDRGEIDASGAERGFRQSSPRGGGARPGGFPDDDVFVDDLFADLMRARRGGTAYGTGAAKGGDATFALPVPFLEAALGAKKRVTMGDGKVLDITVPPGIESGQTLRLKGQGHPGKGGAPAGDALIEITVQPHDIFTRKDRDIHAELAVSLPEAVLGATVTAPTIHGAVTLKVPAGSNNGTKMRLRGKGMAPQGAAAAGDHYVTLRIVLPEPPDPELTQFLETWSRKHGYAVREKIATE